MQDELFGAPPSPPVNHLKLPGAVPKRADDGDSDAPTTPHRRSAEVHPLPPDESTHALAAHLNPRIRLGASTWSYPGWASIVWDEGPYSEAVLAKNGLSAYAQHPLLRCVGIDRSFYRPLTEGQYARYAGQVPDNFRFVVKAPALVTDALVRGEQGQGRQPNTAFLDPVLATQAFITPALAGLGDKVGALVFQLSPLPVSRALWPGPMVCRWNLNPLHGAYGYEDAQRSYEPYDRIHDVDAETRALIVRTVRGVTSAGQNAYVTISNKAEGCAPLSARALAEGLARV